MPTTTPDPLVIAEEAKIKALQTMPEERTDEDVLNDGGCKWRSEAIENGHTWSPRVLPFGEANCVTCTCKVRSSYYNYILNLIAFFLKTLIIPKTKEYFR